MRLPLTLFWPEQASRAETRVRVWGGTGGRRGELMNDGQWRELPPEPMAGRDSLPWYTLASSSAKVPITLELVEDANAGAPPLTVERAILLAAIADDATAICRAKYLLTKWTGATAELQLPPVQSFEVYVDGKRVDGVVPSDTDSPTIAVPLPGMRTGQAAVIELRYRILIPRGPRGVRTLALPRFRNASLRNPLRCHLGFDAANTPLLLSGHLQLELKWAWRALGFAPVAATTPVELEQWFLAGAETEHDDLGTWPTASSDSVAGRQIEPGSIAIAFVPRIAWVGGISLLAFALGYLISRLRPIWFGPVLGALAVVAALSSAIAPHPAAQAFAAMQPGILAFAVVLIGKAALRGYLRRRMSHLPAFSRGGMLPSPAMPSMRGTEGSSPSRIPRSTPIEPTISSRPPSAIKG